ncbi:exonuclease V [Lipomyces chichibuensis]|uniref:exonuclease V n=1 Tax=Lipomyces chichibuensis TaxID=1546026 RepID=UPI0033441760
MSGREQDRIDDIEQPASIPANSPSESSNYGSLSSWDEDIYSAAIASNVVASPGAAIANGRNQQDDHNGDERHVDRMYAAKEALARLTRDLQKTILYADFDNDEYSGRPVYCRPAADDSFTKSPLRSTISDPVIPYMPPRPGDAEVKAKRKRGRPRKVSTEIPVVSLATTPAESPSDTATMHTEVVIGASDGAAESQGDENTEYSSLTDASGDESIQTYQRAADVPDNISMSRKSRKKNIEFELEVPSDHNEQPQSRPRPFKRKRMRFPYLESEGIPSAPIPSEQRPKMLPLHFAEAVDFRGSMLETYKLHRKLYVTDVVGPSWCELQFFYKYYFNDFKPTATMSKGTHIHKELEKQYMLEIPIATEDMTREDKQAVKLLNMLVMLQSLTQGAHRHQENIIVREFPVFGFFEDVFVSGIIDEVSFMYDRPIQDGVEFIDVDYDPESSRQQTLFLPAALQQTFSLEANAGTADFPTLESYSSSQSSIGDQANITSYFKPLSQATLAKILHDHSVASPAVMDSAPDNPWGDDEAFINSLESKRRKIRIADSKTRYIRQLPHESQQRSTYYQLLIYHRLLTDLTKGNFDFGRMTEVLMLDADAELSDIFKREIQENEYVTATLSAEILERGNHRSDEYRASLLSLRTLREVWEALRLKFLEFADETSDQMSVVYYWQDDGQVFAGIDYTYSEDDLQQFVSSSLSYWRGERDPKGVEVEDAYKCRSCTYSEQCLWRLEKIRESTERNRAQFQKRYGKKARSRPLGQLVVERGVDDM